MKINNIANHRIVAMGHVSKISEGHPGKCSVEIGVHGCRGI